MRTQSSKSWTTIDGETRCRPHPPTLTLPRPSACSPARLPYNWRMTAKATIPGGEWAGQIPDFARRIGEAARARRVVLFGSAARGEMGKHSDLDFLVVIPDSMPRDEASEAWDRADDSLRGLNRPSVDIVVATDSVIRRLRDCPYGPIKFALDEGVEVWNDG